jgi:hypothetical protein
VPVTVTALAAANTSAAPPLFVIVIVCDALGAPTPWFPKASVLADKVAVGVPEPVPVPESATFCVEPVTAPESSVMVNVATSPAVVAGVNVNSITHEPFTITVTPLVHVVMVLARALLAEGKLTEGQAAISRAAALSAKIPDIPLHFDIAITSARISTAGNNSSHHLPFARAEKNMESSLAEAGKYGYLEYEYKFRLALGEIELKAGKEHAGSARLEALAGDAKSKGFGLIARQAALAAKTRPLQKN